MYFSDFACTSTIQDFLKDSLDDFFGYYKYSASSFEANSKIEYELKESILGIMGDNENKGYVHCTKNTSESLSTIAFGIDWQPNDVIVTSFSEFSSNRIVWEKIALDRGLKVLYLNRHSESFIEDLSDLIKNNKVRIVSISSVCYLSGHLINISQIAYLTKKHDVYLCIDAAQQVGQSLLNIDFSNVDFIVFPAHKWLMSLEGLGFLWINKNIKLKPLSIGWRNLDKPLDFNSRNLCLSNNPKSNIECGTMNRIAIYATKTSVDFLSEKSLDVIEKDIENKIYFLYDYFKYNKSWVINSCRKSKGIFTLRNVNIDSKKLNEKLIKNNIYISERSGFLRISPHIVTPFSHVEYIANYLSNF